MLNTSAPPLLTNITPFTNVLAPWPCIIAHVQAELGAMRTQYEQETAAKVGAGGQAARAETGGSLSKGEAWGGMEARPACLPALPPRCLPLGPSSVVCSASWLAACAPALIAAPPLGRDTPQSVPGRLPACPPACRWIWSGRWVR